MKWATFQPDTTVNFAQIYVCRIQKFSLKETHKKLFIQSKKNFFSHKETNQQNKNFYLYKLTAEMNIVFNEINKIPAV